jgi:hypothetical protein
MYLKTKQTQNFPTRTPPLSSLCINKSHHETSSYTIRMQSMIISFKNIAKLFALAIAVLFYFIFTMSAHAQVGIPAGGVELDGYAWSSNIGWVSMNCKTGGVTGNDICATSNYKVNLNSAGALTGYAWSSNIGWIRFDGLSSFPVSAGTVAASARVTGTYPNLTFEGWARACAGTTSAAGVCSTMTSRTDGWDGWISLRSTTAPAHSIVMSGNPPEANNGSYAWGSSVVGWIDFNQIRLRTATASLTGTGCQIAIGASTCNGTFTWIITNATAPNVRNNTTNDPYDSVASASNVQYPITFGPNIIQARDNTTVINPPGNYPVTGTCPAGADFTTGTCQPTALPAPVITLTTDRAIARTGDTVNVSWTITPSPLASGTCTLTGPGLPASVTISGTSTSNGLKSKTRFSMVCTGAYGTVRASRDVEIVPKASEV